MCPPAAPPKNGTLSHVLFSPFSARARSDGFDLIAVDSVAALTPKAELEGEIGQATIGLQARLMSAALRKIAANASKAGTTVIMLNQLLMKIGVLYGNPETTPGGQALKFYASARVDVRRKATLEGAGGAQVGIRVRAKVVKNKCAPPYKTAEFDIMFAHGISALGCILDAAEAGGAVTRRGSFYYLGETRLGQGRDKALAALASDPELKDAVEAAARAVLAGEAPPAVGGAAGVGAPAGGVVVGEGAAAALASISEEDEDEADPAA